MTVNSRCSLRVSCRSRFLIADARLELRFFVLALIDGQACNGLVDQTPAPAQVPTSNRVALRMLGEPPFAVAQKLVDFIVPDPVVLLIVEYGDEYIQMRQQLVQPLGRRASP